MTQRPSVVPVRFAAAVLLLCGTVAAVIAQSLERIEYWRTNYQELTPAADPRAATAHAIFAQLVQVAGTRPGVVPRLFITARDPWEIPLPIAIRDGWIILSKGVLEICFREPVWGKDRLAFVLAHELAHHLKDDLWHMRFFDALEAVHTADAGRASLSRRAPPEYRGDRTCLGPGSAGRSTGHYLCHHGRIYPPGHCLGRPGGELFCRLGSRAGSPADHGGCTEHASARRPRNGPRRSGPSCARLRIRRRRFRRGSGFTMPGITRRRSRRLTAFRTVFAGREVHQNLAASHHQLALQAYRAWQPAAQTFPFHLAVAIDPLTRASQIALERTRGQTADPAGQFREHLETAIRWYREALTQDATYTLAARNLGAALILRGVHTPKGRAPSRLCGSRSCSCRGHWSHTPQAPELLNTLGVAWFYDERLDRAQAAFTQAATRDPTYAAPVFNLGVLARAAHREADAQRYQQAYERLIAGPAQRR